MRIVFSRKGFDSTYGSKPSPLINGVPVSLPIPAAGGEADPSATRYRDLQGDLPFGALVHDLTGGKIGADDFCHLDPDIEASRQKRLEGWRGSFGQCTGQLTHLTNNGVGPGDLFIFYGLYREARIERGQWKFSGEEHHRVFGWLRVGERIELTGDRRKDALRQYPWLTGHPHLLEGWGTKTNAVFVGADNLGLTELLGGLPGYGCFSRGYRLTAQGARMKSLWTVPDWVNPMKGGVGLTCHPTPDPWGETTLITKSPAQEYVADLSRNETAKDAALEWLEVLFNEAGCGLA